MPAVHRVRSSAVLRHCPVVLLRQGRYRELPSLSPLLNTLARNIHTRSGAMCAEPLASTTRGHIQIVESDDDLADCAPLRVYSSSKASARRRSMASLMSWNTKIARAPMRFLCSGLSVL